MLISRITVSSQRVLFSSCTRELKQHCMGFICKTPQRSPGYLCSLPEFKHRTLNVSSQDIVTLAVPFTHSKLWKNYIWILSCTQMEQAKKNYEVIWFHWSILKCYICVSATTLVLFSFSFCLLIYKKTARRLSSVFIYKKTEDSQSCFGNP